MSNVTVVQVGGDQRNTNRKSKKKWTFLQDTLNRLLKLVRSVETRQDEQGEAIVQIGENQHAAQEMMVEYSKMLNEKIGELELEIESEVKELKESSEVTDQNQEEITDKVNKIQDDIVEMKEILNDVIEKNDANLKSMKEEVSIMKESVSDLKSITDQAMQKIESLTSMMEKLKKDQATVNDDCRTQMKKVREDVEQMKKKRCENEVLDCMARVLLGIFFSTENASATFTDNHLEIQIEIKSRRKEFSFLQNEFKERKIAPRVKDVKAVLTEQANNHQLLRDMIGNYTNRFIANISNN